MQGYKEAEVNEAKILGLAGKEALLEEPPHQPKDAVGGTRLHCTPADGERGGLPLATIRA